MTKSSDWIEVEKKYYAQTVRRQPVCWSRAKVPVLGMPMGKSI